ncbi:MAG: ATP-binding protein [bacterium]|nr:ATP-binding protein [bacterium]
MAGTTNFKFLKTVGKPIEYRLFEIVNSIAVILMAFWVVYGIIVGYETPIMIIYTSALVIFLALWLAFRNNINFRIVTGIFYLFSAIAIAFAWFPSGGSYGAIMHSFVLIYISGLLILKPRAFLTYSVVMVSIAIAASVLEYINPDLAAPYVDTKQRIMDIGIANVAMLIIVSLCIFLFKRANDLDRNKIEDLFQNLEKEKTKAESADHAKSQFLATISHEMRTPLNGILGISELLNQTELNEEQSQLVRNLIVSSEMLHNLVSDVLDLTQIEDNKLVLHEVDFDLSYEIKNIKSIFVDRIKREDKNVELVFDFDDKIDVVLTGDVLRLKQVIINLVNNALKFTERGMIKVSTELLEEREKELLINVSVRDTGIGIPKDQLKKLFNKFSKIDTPEHNRKDGTGLGLVITKNIVEAMQGEVRVSSEFGVGSVFSFIAPFKIAENQELEQANVEDIDLSPHKLKVLIAEDYEINRLVATKTLLNLGIAEVETAIDGMEAYEKAVIGSPDFILMDMKMPELDGLGATELILDKYREDHRTPPVIIATTANALKEDIDACLQVGMSHFVSKPYNQQTIYNAFKRFLTNGHNN